MVKRLLAVGALTGVLACNGGMGSARSSGSLAASNDSKFLYAADTDNGVLVVVDARTLEVVREVKVGVRPFRVLVGRDGAIYVANRGSRSVSVIRDGEASVAGEIVTGIDPVGMQLSSDGKTLYVVSATASESSEYGILQSIETATLKENWVLPVGEEPRGLALLDGERALISLYKAGEVVHVDLKAVQVLDAKVEVYGKLNRSALESTTTGQTRATTPVTFQPRAMTDIAVTPDGKRAFVATQLSREAPILTNPSPATPYYQAQGPRLAGSVTTPAILTFDSENAQVVARVEDVTEAPTYYYAGSSGNDRGHPQTSFAVSGVPQYSYSSDGTYTQKTSPVLQGISAAVVDMTGQWMFMVNRESRNVSVVSTQQQYAKPNEQANGNYYISPNELPSVHSTAEIGHGADGIAILGDNATAFVYNQFDHTVQRLTLNGSRDGVTVTRTSKPLVRETLPQDQVAGRKLFHDANDRSISSVSASVACSSCHLEGRDDGHTWQFPDGPRQTPTLAGRGMFQTQPFHWSGEFDTMRAFLDHTIISRMGGTGLQELPQASLNSYVDGIPAPENPYKRTELTEQQSRGAQVFSRAACATCHSGQWLTNNSFADVGTLSAGINPDLLKSPQGLNVPSLRGLARSAPYLHTGKATSLKERLINNPGDQHGKTSGLTSAEMDDLVEFLRTL